MGAAEAEELGPEVDRLGEDLDVGVLARDLVHGDHVGVVGAALALVGVVVTGRVAPAQDQLVGRNQRAGLGVGSHHALLDRALGVGAAAIRVPRVGGDRVVVDPAGDLLLPEDRLLLVGALGVGRQIDGGHPHAVALRLVVALGPGADRVGRVGRVDRARAARALLALGERDVEQVGELAVGGQRGAGGAGDLGGPEVAVVGAVAVAAAPLADLGDAGGRVVADHLAGLAVLLHRAVIVVLGERRGLLEHDLAGLVEALDVADGVVGAVGLVVVLRADHVAAVDRQRGRRVGVAALVAVVVGDELGGGGVGDDRDLAGRGVLGQRERGQRQLDGVGCADAVELGHHGEVQAALAVAEQREGWHLGVGLLLVGAAQPGWVAGHGGRVVLRLGNDDGDRAAMDFSAGDALVGGRNEDPGHGEHQELLVGHWWIAPGFLVCDDGLLSKACACGFHL